MIRSFDMSEPGAEIDELKDGVAGRSILTGVLSLEMEVEIRPRVVTRVSTGRNRCQQIYPRFVSLHAVTSQIQFAVLSGLIGVGTKINPTACHADWLAG